MRVNNKTLQDNHFVKIVNMVSSKSSPGQMDVSIVYQVNTQARPLLYLHVQNALKVVTKHSLLKQLVNIVHRDNIKYMTVNRIALFVSPVHILQQTAPLVLNVKPVDNRPLEGRLPVYTVFQASTKAILADKTVRNVCLELTPTLRVISLVRPVCQAVIKTNRGRLSVSCVRWVSIKPM